MHRLAATLTVIAAVVVFAVAGYVIVHHDPVARAGQTPGYTAPPSTTPAPPSGSASPEGAGKTTPTVAFLGDDYTTGTGASAKAERFTTLVCKRLGVTEQNFGADGAGYASPSAAGAYLSRVAQVVAAKPDVVVVSGGRNDVLDNADTVAAHATALFTTLHAELPNAVLVAVAPFWGDSAPQAALARIADSIRRAVEAAGGTYLDIADPLRGHPEWMADAADPNDAGYAAIATALESKLRPLMPASSTASSTTASVSPAVSPSPSA